MRFVASNYNDDEKVHLAFIASLKTILCLTDHVLQLKTVCEIPMLELAMCSQGCFDLELALQLLITTSAKKVMSVCSNVETFLRMADHVL